MAEVPREGLITSGCAQATGRTQVATSQLTKILEEVFIAAGPFSFRLSYAQHGIVQPPSSESLNIRRQWHSNHSLPIANAAPSRPEKNLLAVFESSIARGRSPLKVGANLRTRRMQAKSNAADSRA